MDLRISPVYNSKMPSLHDLVLFLRSDLVRLRKAVARLSDKPKRAERAPTDRRLISSGEFLRGLLPVGRKALLVGPDADLERDRYQRALAVIFIPEHEGLSGPPTIVQEAIIRAGWSPLWEKYGKVSFDWRPRLAKAEQEAKEAKAGA